MKLTVEAQSVIERAISLSTELNNNYVGSDHLLVALLTDAGMTEANAIIETLNLPVNEIIKCVHPKTNDSNEPETNRPFVPRLKNLLSTAGSRALKRDGGPIGTEDLLYSLALTDGPSGKALTEAIISSSRRVAYTMCSAAELLSSIGDIFRDRETYPH